MHTGTNIKKIRQKKGIDKSHLANILKVDVSYIDKIENQKIEPQVSDLLKIAGALGTDIAALMYGKEFTEKKAIVTKSDSRLQVERKSHYNYESLAPFYTGKHMEPYIVEIFKQDEKKTAVMKDSMTTAFNREN